jgi:hypothetical protein
VNGGEIRIKGERRKEKGERGKTEVEWKEHGEYSFFIHQWTRMRHKWTRIIKD